MARRWPLWLAASLLLVLGLCIDHMERFFQGDSVSYLGTYIGANGRFLPPDRSWLFGLAVNALVRLTGSEHAFMALQALALLLVLMACSSLFAETSGGRRAHAVFVVACCLDPIIGFYTRFYMTDLLAALLFLLFLASLRRALQATREGFWRWLPGLALIAAAAVFIRVSYFPILMVSVAFIGFGAVRLRLSVLRRLLAAAALPVLGMAALVGANRIIFADQFPGEFFVNKLSGVFLLGSFAPALAAEDFRAAGVDVSDAEVAALRLPDYERRGNQIWGEDDTDAQALIKRRLGITVPYTRTVDAACARIVLHGLRRSPLSFLRVYATTLLFHFEPSHWRPNLAGESGITRTLPQGFVGMMNRFATPRITTATTAKWSIMLAAFLRLAPAYSSLLAATGLAAGWHLLAGRTDPGCLVASAGFLAVVATVPLYTVSVIPRYLIGAVPLVLPVWAGFDWARLWTVAQRCFSKAWPAIATKV